MLERGKKKFVRARREDWSGREGGKKGERREGCGPAGDSHPKNH
jgi:hypothetical protein